METTQPYFSADGPLRLEELARAVEALFAADDGYNRTGRYTYFGEALCIRKQIEHALKRFNTTQE